MLWNNFAIVPLYKNVTDMMNLSHLQVTYRVVACNIYATCMLYKFVTSLEISV